MSWRPHSRARTNPRAPEAWGKCDRCGSLYQLRTLRYQHEWAGTLLRNLRLRVCGRCTDVPNEQLRTIRPGADPRPVRDPRPINNIAVMGGYAVLQRSPVYTPGLPLYVSDVGDDVGPDASALNPGPGVDGLTALALTLNTYTPGTDAVQGYSGSPFSTEDDELTGIPLSIDPPE